MLAEELFAAPCKTALAENLSYAQTMQKVNQLNIMSRASKNRYSTGSIMGVAVHSPEGFPQCSPPILTCICTSYIDYS